LHPLAIETSPKHGYLHGRFAALGTSDASETGRLVKEICCGLGLLWEGVLSATAFGLLRY